MELHPWTSPPYHAPLATESSPKCHPAPQFILGQEPAPRCDCLRGSGRHRCAASSPRLRAVLHLLSQGAAEGPDCVGGGPASTRTGDGGEAAGRARGPQASTRSTSLASATPSLPARSGLRGGRAFGLAHITGLDGSPSSICQVYCHSFVRPLGSRRGNSSSAEFSLSPRATHISARRTVILRPTVRTAGLARGWSSLTTVSWPCCGAFGGKPSIPGLGVLLREAPPSSKFLLDSHLFPAFTRCVSHARFDRFAYRTLKRITHTTFAAAS